MMVDNSIVVLENICRLYEAAWEPAAIQGTEEVVAPIIASALTTLAILSVGFRAWHCRRAVQQLAYVVSFALVCSLWVALTLVPMLTALILKPHGAVAKNMARCDISLERLSAG